MFLFTQYTFKDWGNVSFLLDRDWNTKVIWGSRQGQKLKKQQKTGAELETVFSRGSPALKE